MAAARLLAFILLASVACTEGATRKKRKWRPDVDKKLEKEDLSPFASKPVEELVIEVIHKPEKCSKQTKSGDVVSMHYTGRLTSGKIFDSTSRRNAPFEFKLGAGNVIKGWDEGLLDMCIGEKRTLRIPPSKAYGEAGRPPVIPRSSTLVFETELVAIKSS